VLLYALRITILEVALPQFTFAINAMFLAILAHHLFPTLPALHAIKFPVTTSLSVHHLLVSLAALRVNSPPVLPKSAKLATQIV